MTDGQTDRRTDICDCRVAFATENNIVERTINEFHPVMATIMIQNHYSISV